MPVLENQRHERFANGVAAGKTKVDAYVSAGYSPQGASPSAARLLRNASIRGRIEELKTRAAEQVVLQIGIQKNSRLARYQARLAALDAIVKARSTDPSNGVAPGGNSGWMCRREKVIGGGDNAREVEEFEVDTTFLREMRELEKQIAVELGEWVEKKEATHDNPNVQVNVAVRQEMIDLGPEFARDYLALVEAHARKATGDGAGDSASGG